MKMLSVCRRSTKLPLQLFLAAGALSVSVAAAQEVRPLAPLVAVESPDAAQVALGRQLFFDPRLSGDATISCADVPQPGSWLG